MSELIEYFVRHYTLVLDNDQGPYEACREAARAAILGETPDLTLAQYQGMNEHERINNYAQAVGEQVLLLIEEWTDELLQQHDDGVGVLLIREVLITNGSDLAYELGKHYLPEDEDATDFLDDETEEEDDE